MKHLPGMRAMVIALTTALIIAADQITKHLAKVHLKGRGVIRVVGELFIFHFAENEGAFLGLGSSWAPPFRFIILTLIPLGVLAVVIYYLIRSKPTNPVQSIGLSLILGGGVSNIVDRILHSGKVIDFMNLGIGRLRTGIFNIADLCIMGGSVLLFLSLRDTTKTETEPNKDDQA